MKVTALDRQSLIDIALQTSGGMEAAMALSIKYDVAISEPLATDAQFEMVAAVDKLVLARYEAQKVKPATALSSEDLATAPYGGIGYMGIEIDFIVS